jgi:hypothetical protein
MLPQDRQDRIAVAQRRRRVKAAIFHLKALSREHIVQNSAKL